MTNTPRLKIAIQKNGRLSNESLNLLLNSGLDIQPTKNTLICQANNLPVDILFVRDDDIPTLVTNNVCDLGIIGNNVFLEKTINQINCLSIVRKLGFCQCRLSLATAYEFEFTNIHTLMHKRVATSYPNLLRTYLQKYKIFAEIILISGSVEIAPRLGMADAICDLVSTGRTLKENNLKEVAQIMQSEAILIKNRISLSAEKYAIYQSLLKNIDNALIKKIAREVA